MNNRLSDDQLDKVSGGTVPPKAKTVTSADGKKIKLTIEEYNMLIRQFESPNPFAINNWIKTLTKEEIYQMCGRI